MELETAGYRVTAAAGCDDGLKALKTERYQLVLCDFRMARMSGAALTRAFREWEAKHRPNDRLQPIVGISAYADQNVTQECLLAGMQGMIAKPLSLRMGEVHAMVRALDASNIFGR